MAEASTIRRAAKKIPSLLEKLKSSGDEDRAPVIKEIHDFLDEIGEAWTPGNIPEEDETIAEMANLLDSLREMSEDTYSEELDHVLSFVTNSSVLWRMKLMLMGSRDDYEGIMNLTVEDRPLVLDDDSLEVIFRAARALGKFREAAVFLSRRNVYFPRIFEGYADGETELSANQAILENFRHSRNEEAALSFLGLLEDRRSDVWARLRIVEILEARSRGDMINELEAFPFEDITELQEYRNMGYLLLRNDLPEMALMMVANALKAFPEDYELLKIKAGALLRKDVDIEAYEIFKQLAVRNNTDLSVIKNAISLAFKQQLYEECQNIIDSYPDAKKDPAVMARKISCEIQTSRFTEALNDLDQALGAHPEERELLDLKLRTLIKLNKESEAFNLARDLMQADPENSEATDYAMGWLAKRGEYETIVNLCDESEILKHRYKALYIACEIHEDDFKVALKELGQNPELLNSNEVVDAIFFNVREESFLMKLDALNSSLQERSEYYGIVVNRLRGIRPRIEKLDESMLSRNTSQAVAYIISYEYFSSRAPNVPDAVRSMLYLPAFKEIRAMMEILSSAHDGKLSDDVVDSARFLFPLTEALIGQGMLDRAESQLMRSSHNDDDPFYRYYLGLIDFHRENYTSARKYVENALDSLRNADFLKLAILISVISEDQKDFREYLDRIVELNLIDSFDFSELYSYISRHSLWDMAAILVGVDADGTHRNPWIVRMKRDLAVSLPDYRKAIESSSVLFATNQYLKDDVQKHMDILRRSEKDLEITNFLLDLETENKSSWLEITIGDEYYRSSRFNQALEHYGEAISLGAFPEDIPNYIDTLIECGRYDESTELVQKTDNKLLLLKLYQKTSNIQAALDLLGKLTFKKEEDQEIVRYAAENLWYNTDVRDYLVNLYKQEGYSWLGKIIAIRTFENKDTKLSLEIARNLNKNSPEDLQIVRMYADLLIRAGQREDAIQVILQSLKYCGDFTRCIDITNMLMRLYYEDRDYEAVVKFYETNPKYIDEKSLQFVIRSYMERDNFDMAEKLISRYEGTLLRKDLHNELREDLKTKKEFMETLFYVSRLLKLEFKVGKKFDKKEAFYKADIPIEQIEPVYQFLGSRDFYFDVNEEKYEILTRDVIQKAVKNAEMEGLKDLLINVIYNNLDRKDPILARNIYIYIKDQMDVARRPRLKDEPLLKLLRIALKENIKQEPLHIAFYLKVGIADALEVMTLMEYMSRINEEGDI